ncbi:unnamed protein product [Hymenolepis diminuta]|uniref:UTP--glucose-1-phosphate uridylyltransferase n=1 Tax=Hymenolepis diminuta TaxID=6216 RepID=A0A0R3SK23_HYMDI|nr:unnamed protein product [Hymenolepis diminuta]
MAVGKIKSYNRLSEPTEQEITSALSKLVVLKLNGGLGTSMNCNGAKSLIPVKNGKTFLEMTLQQIDHLNEQYNSSIPFVLMNSFNTDDETVEFLQKMEINQTKPIIFQQNRFPRLYEESGLPIADSCQLKGLRDQAWYPPGHGDVYRSLQKSGLLERFIEEGKNWIFLSNIDNIGATPDLKILCWLEEQEKKGAEHRIDFLMEVADKTPTDKKGGTLVPEDHVKDFQDSNQFKFFNTNNLWINVKALSNILKDDDLTLDLIVNKKTIKDGTKVIQLEEACGAAINCFKKPMSLRVPRSRFLPVKLTSDLLILRSDLFEATTSGLKLSPQHALPSLPTIEFSNHFKGVEDLERRISDPPSMIHLRHLTLNGNIRFGSNVILKGTVKIIPNNDENFFIPDGIILENTVITEPI